jgi:DNA polymerase-4
MPGDYFFIIEEPFAPLSGASGKWATGDAGMVPSIESTDRGRVIFHVDMDAFFASIEQRDHPAWRGMPVIVGAQPGRRGVVSAASYEARRFGVHSAMPINQAHAQCPNGIFTRPRMAVYAAESRRLMAILESFSPIIEPVSVDEAFVDMSGTGALFGSPRQAAEAIARRIRDERALTGSIGIAPNKFLAKLASDCNKPAGITHAPFAPQEIIAWLAPMPVSRIWGVGEKMTEALAGWGIHTIADLQQLSSADLQKRFGAGGLLWHDLCRGIDTREMSAGSESKSISREHTFSRDCADPAAWRSMLLTLADDVARQARSEGLMGRTIVFTYRKPDFSRHSRRLTLSRPTHIGKEIFDTAARLLDETARSVPRFRLIGIGLTGFMDAVQTDLFERHDSRKAWEASETARDSIVEKYGDGALIRATALTPGKRPRGRRPDA